MDKTKKTIIRSYKWTTYVAMKTLTIGLIIAIATMIFQRVWMVSFIALINIIIIIMITKLSEKIEEDKEDETKIKDF